MIHHIFVFLVNSYALMGKLANYSNFIKFEHTLFSLPIILAGVFLAAKGVPDLKLLILILLAGVGARTAALGINRIIDRKIDSANSRTSNRELPSGKISLNEAFAIVGFGLGVYFASCYLICDLVFYLSPIPLLVFVIYPLLKRFTSLCHFGVGLALALAPLGGWIAVTCSLENLFAPIMLALFTFFWVSGFDIIYATLDEEFDKKNNIFSIVSRFGRGAGLVVSAILHIFAFLTLLILNLLVIKKGYSSLALLVIGFLLFLEQKKSSNVDLAFFKINILIGAMVFIFILCGLYLP